MDVPTNGSGQSIPQLFDVWWASIFGSVHPHSRRFPWMRPHLCAIIILCYIAAVIVGQLFLRGTARKIRAKLLIRGYNAFMVLLSLFMCVRGAFLAAEVNDTLWCVPMARGMDGRAMASLVWLFTFSKVIEFCDTLFMMVEGRWRQVSFLHVYHHITIFAYWFAITWKAPGSDAYFSLVGNSLIHVLMYGYYLLASFGYKPRWKYCITYSQILQFVSFAAQSVYVGYIKTDKVCDFPNILSRGLLWYMLTLIALFLHFLITNKPGAKRSAAAKAARAAIKKKK